MTVKLVLEDFLSPVDTPEQSAQMAPSVAPNTGDFEDGYKAGWDDAVAADHNTRNRVSAELAQSLDDVQFSFHEARAHLLKEIGPILSLIAEKALPTLAHSEFPKAIAAIVQQALDQATEAALELAVHPVNLEAVQNVLPDDPTTPITAVADTLLAEGQAILRTAQGEKMIDIDEVLTGIQNAIHDFLNAGMPTQERQHGQ